MPVLPTPTGLPTQPNLTSPTPTTRAQAVNGYVSFLSSSYGTSVGNSFRMYAASHSNLSANAALNQWGNLMAASLGPGLANAISQEESAAAGLAGKTVGALPALDIFHDLNLSTLFLRVGEIILGVVLVGVGLAHLTGADNVVSNIAKKGLL